MEQERAQEVHDGRIVACVLLLKYTDSDAVVDKRTVERVLAAGRTSGVALTSGETDHLSSSAAPRYAEMKRIFLTVFLTRLRRPPDRNGQGTITTRFVEPLVSSTVHKPEYREKRRAVQQ